MLEAAKSSVKRIKTLRHPSVLQYIDSLETDRVVYLVTERVEPLDLHLRGLVKEEEKKLAISWGICQVARGVSFLTKDCGLSHNNVCLWSVFVDKAGEWKIGGLDYVCAASDRPPAKMLPALDRYGPPEVVAPASGKPRPKWAQDSWGLGCLIWEIFNGPLPDSSSLGAPGKIPRNVASLYGRLVNPNPALRLAPSDFVAKCRASGCFLDNSFVDAMLFIEEIQIKDATEKNRFFLRLTSSMDDFPSNVCKYKILPQLINAFEFGDAGSAVLTPLFKIGTLLDAEEYQRKIVPCIVKLFSSKDRATRARLLQQVDQFVDHLEPAVVNREVFPHVVQGFADTNPAIREQTVKAMVHLAPKLDYRNLNEELMKHFARLQARDEQGGIRTNTTVCLGKIACHLDPQTRQKVLIVAFVRSMRDPFPPARMAGILALSATQGYYTLKDCAAKVLPALCTLTVDPEKDVRDQAFRAIGGFLGKLEKVSEDPGLLEQMEADVNAASCAVRSSVAGGWAGWAVSSLASKFYKSSAAPRLPAADASPDDRGRRGADPSERAPETVSAAVPSERLRTEEAAQDFVSDSDEKWEDQDWGSMEEEPPLGGSSDGTERPGDGWDDVDWESPEDVPLPEVREAPTRGDSGPCSGNGSRAATAWDDWGTTCGKGDCDREEAKRQREEKRQQRLEERRERRAARAAGPMKLAVRKDLGE